MQSGMPLLAASTRRCALSTASSYAAIARLHRRYRLTRTEVPY